MSLMYRFGYPFVWAWCKIIWRLKIKILAPLPEGPLVLCCNHLYTFDSLVLAMITKRQVYYMAKKELMRGFLGWLIRSLGAYSVDRVGNDIHAVRYTLTLLKQGKVVGIFPEGHRSPDGAVHEFHPGAAMFAIRTKASLVPVGMSGTFRPFSKVRLVVGEALELSEYHARRTSSDDVSRVNEILHERVSTLAKTAKEMP